MVEKKTSLTIQEIFITANYKVSLLLDSYLWRSIPFSIYITNQANLKQNLKSLLGMNISIYLGCYFLLLLNFIVYIDFLLKIPFFYLELIFYYLSLSIMMSAQVYIYEKMDKYEDINESEKIQMKTQTDKIYDTAIPIRDNSQISFFLQGNDSSRKKLQFDMSDMKGKSFLDLSQIPENECKFFLVK